MTIALTLCAVVSVAHQPLQRLVEAPRTAHKEHGQLFSPPCNALQPRGCIGIVLVATSLQGRCLPGFQPGRTPPPTGVFFRGKTCFPGRRLLFYQHEVSSGLARDEISR